MSHVVQDKIFLFPDHIKMFFHSLHAGQFLTLLLSSADFFKKFFQENDQSVKWFDKLTFCQYRFGSNLFAKVISR